jgi:hypothetical protein
VFDGGALDGGLAVLHARARDWVVTPPAEKRDLLARLGEATAEVAEDWVRVSCRGKGIAVNSPASGEEWLSGPYALLSNVAALIRLLDDLLAGRNPLNRVRTVTTSSGQVALRVFPVGVQDMVQPGYAGYVWLRPGITLDEANAGVARKLRDSRLPGKVALVLGAGNINSIAALDALGKLYQDNAVVMMKLNPVNDYLEPILSRAFAGFVEAGFVRITSGGVDVGSYLANHPLIDTIHLTGSRDSHDAIVFGSGADGLRRKAERRPLNCRPISSELSGVGSVIMVPGRWSDRALRLQAENVATQRLHNSGFNCIATQIAVLPEHWPHADRFLDYLRQAIREAPTRPGYYPGAADRQRRAVHTHAHVELLGGDPQVMRTLLLDLDPNDADEPAFREEYFSPVLGITRLPGATAAQFINNAVEFCNDRLYGDLGVGLVVAPRTIRDLGPLFDQAVTRLRYGTVAINCWAGVVYGMARSTWGAFPGHDIYDVGSGTGIVHNALLLDPGHVERSVGSGPFRPWPKPVWFVSNHTAHITAQHMVRFVAEPSLAKAVREGLAAFTSSLRG